MIASCDPLDVAPTDLIPAEDAITTEKGLRAAVAGVYDGLQNGDIAQELMIFGDLAADNLEAVGSRIAYREVFNNRITPNNIRIEGIWNAHYDVINRANVVLANLDNVNGVSETQKNTFRGELLFIRALCHFNLVKAFGAVPVKTAPTLGISPEEVDVPRVSIDQVYNQIKTDLEEAIMNLEGTGKGNSIIASEGAAYALLARTSLFQKEYSAVIEATSSIMTFGYVLQEGSSYAEIFNEANENDEIIFQIDFSDNDVNALADYFQPSARYEVALASGAFNLFTSDDNRTSVSAQASGSDLYCNKYTNISLDSDNSIVLRYADVLLMRAEALNEQAYDGNGEAFDLINSIRNRAGLDSLDANNVPTQAAFRQAILLERRKEFIGEGHRWFDLIRTGSALGILGNAKGITSESQLLFPIPQSELDANNHPKMTQNKDY